MRLPVLFISLSAAALRFIFLAIVLPIVVLFAEMAINGVVFGRVIYGVAVKDLGASANMAVLGMLLLLGFNVIFLTFWIPIEMFVLHYSGRGNRILMFLTGVIGFLYLVLSLCSSEGASVGGGVGVMVAIALKYMFEVFAAPRNQNH